MRDLKARRSLAILLTGSILGLTGCAVPSDTGNVYDTAIATDVDQQLAQSTARAANSLETLSMIQRVRTAPVAPAVDESTLPPELKRPVKTISYSGPARELVQKLAASVGYSFSVQGAMVANEPFASFNIHDVSAAQAFADIGLQVQQFATVIVNPNTRSVIFRFENHSPAAQGERIPYSGVHHRASAPRHPPLVK